MISSPEHEPRTQTWTRQRTQTVRRILPLPLPLTRYIQNPKVRMGDVSDAVGMLCEVIRARAKPAAHQDSTRWRTTSCYTEETDAVLRQAEPWLRTIFETYSRQDGNVLVHGHRRHRSCLLAYLLTCVLAYLLTHSLVHGHAPTTAAALIVPAVR